MKSLEGINRNIFRAYDVRGQYPKELNEKSVLKIAEVLSRHFRSGQIIFGHDARFGSPELYNAVLKVFRRNKKFNIHSAGFMTTPMLYFLVNHFGARGGIMITASHNPKQYNGLKVIGSHAIQISGREILKLIEKL